VHGEAWAGELMDGATAAITPVRLVPDIADLKIVGEGGGALASWPRRSIRVERLSGGLFHLRQDGEAAMVSTRDPAVAAWVGAPPAAPSMLGRVVGLGAAFAAALGALYLSLPLVSGAIARRVPPAIEEKLALQIAPLLSRCRDPEGEAALAELVGRLRPAGSSAEVWVVDDEMVNAFALPGGRIVLMRGLLGKAERPEEVAGVLAHELAHVAHRHVMTQIVRGTILSALWSATLGDYSGLLLVDPSVAYQIGMRRFSRDDEREADRDALAALDAAAISRDGFADFFRRMQSITDKVPGLLSTHPTTRERLQLIAGGSAPARPTRPALSPQQWTALRGICKRR
jgi:Zn-dependent protease with chaperone function